MTRLLIKKKPIFTIRQFDRLSNILDNAGQVILGVVVIGPFFTNQQINSFVLIIGTISVITFWITSLLIVNKGGEYNGY